MIKKIIEFLVGKIPLSSNILAFNSFPDYTDNAYAMFLYLHREYGDKFKYVWLINDEEAIASISDKENDLPNVKIKKKKSLIGFWYFFRAKHVFYTHGIFESILVRQSDDKMINLWHGMPLKRIGLMDGKPKGYMHNLQYTIATSEMFRKIMADSFGIDEQKVLITGQPRCDLFDASTDFFENSGIDKAKYSSIGIWLPTYRKSLVSTEVREDGDFKDGKISFLDAEGLGILNEVLCKQGNLLLIKLHPMDVLQNFDFINFSNIKIIKQKDFHSQLYPLLGKCDYLITDFSSVWVDFELTGKPMAFVFDDFEKYSSNRGFTINNLSNMLPGEIINNMDGLIEFINNPRCIKKHIEFNKHRDCNASKRIANFLGIK